MGPVKGGDHVELTKRPKRQEPPIERIAEWWGLHEHACWRCGCTTYPDRAHLVDRQHGGLDGEQNLALLCYPCHVGMPSFVPGEEELAKTYAFAAVRANGGRLTLSDAVHNLWRRRLTPIGVTVEQFERRMWVWARPRDDDDPDEPKTAEWLAELDHWVNVASDGSFPTMQALMDYVDEQDPEPEHVFMARAKAHAELAALADRRSTFPSLSQELNLTRDVIDVVNRGFAACQAEWEAVLNDLPASGGVHV